MNKTTTVDRIQMWEEEIGSCPQCPHFVVYTSVACTLTTTQWRYVVRISDELILDKPGVHTYTMTISMHIQYTVKTIMN